MHATMMILRTIVFSFFVIPCGWNLMMQGKPLAGIVVMIVLGALACHVTRMEE